MPRRITTFCNFCPKMLKIYKFDLIVFNRQQERDETENLLVGSVWDLNNKSWSYWCCWSILVILLVLLVHPIFSTTAFSLIAVGQLHQKMTCETENFLVGNVLNLNNKCKGFHIGVGGPRHLFHQHGFLTQCCRLVFNWQQERWHVKLRTSWLEMCEIWTRNEGDFILFIGVVGPRHLFDRHGFLARCHRLVAPTLAPPIAHSRLLPVSLVDTRQNKYFAFSIDLALFQTPVFYENWKQGWVRCKKCGTLHDFACHPCAGAMLIFSVSFQF